MFSELKNKTRLSRMNSAVKEINKYYLIFDLYSDQELLNYTNVLKEKLKKNPNLDLILPEAFALVKVAAGRTLGITHYDEQLKAGIAMHQGYIVEMKTGEGKTLSATLPAYLNALQNRVHIATVNDYLAKRDADEMSKLYNFLGLTCGAVLDSTSEDDKKKIYACDIVYGTGSQFGFDYLRDNQKYNEKDLYNMPFSYIIIDEIDRMLDDGSTPLIISQPSFNQKNNNDYQIASKVVKLLNKSDLIIDKKNESVYFTNDAIEKVENLLKQNGKIIDEPLFSRKYQSLVHALHQCLKAEYFFLKDHQYIVNNKTIQLIDQMTGRILSGRSYSNGLQQAIEAKENLQLQGESDTAGAISYQKYYNLYKKISGMSGTCFAEAEEFELMFGIDVVKIPTHKKLIRKDLQDRIYNTLEEKTYAIIQEIKIANKKLQPILLITNSIESSEYFSNELKKHNIKHSFLNAKHAKEEAEIIADAGKPGAVVIATNMAGRGTDIQLGGNLSIEMQKLDSKSLSKEQYAAEVEKIKQKIKQDREIVLEAGGLFVIGTERNENSRVDLQARGRSGRQGDPGVTLFFLCFDDVLIKRFVQVDSLRALGETFNIFKKNEMIDDSMIINQMKNFQKESEAMENENRKSFLRFENIEDLQRKVFYTFRSELLKEYNMNKKLEDIISKQNLYMPQKIEIENIKVGQIKVILLEILDHLWTKYLKDMSDIKDGIYLIASSGKDIYIEYQKQITSLFYDLLQDFNNASYLVILKHLNLKIEKRDNK